jgi:DNA-binding response OmpR family regulator
VKRILVVEDEPTILAAVATRLRAEDFLVETAVDGPSAVATAAATAPDLVVLDVMLPGFDGLEVCRRMERAGDAGEAQSLSVGGYRLDLQERRVHHGEREVHLTRIEFDLLAFLASRPRTAVTRDTLLEYVWGWASGVETRTVDSHVKALRRKLGAGLIRTVHGVGYALETPR